jgi:hypothetical protein
MEDNINEKLWNGIAVSLKSEDDYQAEEAVSVVLASLSAIICCHLMFFSIWRSNTLSNGKT